jgi:hypothetical protein
MSRALTEHELEMYLELRKVLENRVVEVYEAINDCDFLEEYVCDDCHDYICFNSDGITFGLGTGEHCYSGNLPIKFLLAENLDEAVKQENTARIEAEEARIKRIVDAENKRDLELYLKLKKKFEPNTSDN